MLVPCILRCYPHARSDPYFMVYRLLLSEGFDWTLVLTRTHAVGYWLACRSVVQVSNRKHLWGRGVGAPRVLNNGQAFRTPRKNSLLVSFSKSYCFVPTFLYVSWTQASVLSFCVSVLWKCLQLNNSYMLCWDLQILFLQKKITPQLDTF